MKKFKITEQQAQTILNYISSIPTGNIPFNEAYAVTQILVGLEEIKTNITIDDSGIVGETK